MIAERGFYGDGRNKWIIWEQTAAVLGYETRCIAELAGNFGAASRRSRGFGGIGVESVRAVDRDRSSMDDLGGIAR